MLFCKIATDKNDKQKHTRRRAASAAKTLL